MQMALAQNVSHGFRTENRYQPSGGLEIASLQIINIQLNIAKGQPWATPSYFAYKSFHVML